MKLARMQAGARPRILDLFSGCGGISLGFHAAGCEISAAMELDEHAARSHGINFHSGEKRHSQARDITATEPADLARELDMGDPAEAVDIIVGGPPCQAFARVGRSKLREIDEHPEAFKHDPRARLYIDYLNYVDAFKPVAVLMENVPDVMNHGGRNIAEEVCDVLEHKGYICGYTLLNSAYYGVPQMRERMFLVGYHKRIAAEPGFPEPTHWMALPPGYNGTRRVALKQLSSRESVRYVPPPVPDPSLRPAITAHDALSDLPPITLHLEGRLKRGARRFNVLTPYGNHPHTIYGKLMRNWPEFCSEDGIYDHVIRYLPRDYPLFARMQPGDQYPEAFGHAQDMLREKVEHLRAEGQFIPENGTIWHTLQKAIVPPYDATKFPNKWRKMWKDQPARTLMAHLGKDSYSHIHYDSDQARTISVREAARLQSFPDGFIFSGTMNPAFRQIGNAVPPLMAKAIAEKMLTDMGLSSHLAGNGFAHESPSAQGLHV